MAAATLEPTRKKQPAKRRKAGTPYADPGFVFCKEIGWPLDESNVCHRHGPR